MRNGIFLALLLLSAACQDVARPPASPPADERSPGIGGLIVASFYFDAAEAAVRTLEFTERLLADEAWIGRQAVIRGITADSVRRELSAESTHTERYLEKKASTQGMTGPEYRRVVEGRMRRVRLANGYEKLLPSRPSQAQTGTATAVAGAPACERRPQMETWLSGASVTVSGNNVTATYFARHTSDRPADQSLNMTWRHNHEGSSTGIATPSRRQLSICRDHATADHEVSWNKCGSRSLATASARSGHVTSDIRYGGTTLITRGSHASDRVSVDKSGCGSSGDESTLFEADPSCISGYRAGTGECCDDMIHIHGDLWCVIVN